MLKAELEKELGLAKKEIYDQCDKIDHWHTEYLKLKDELKNYTKLKTGATRAKIAIECCLESKFDMSLDDGSAVHYMSGCVPTKDEPDSSMYRLLIFMWKALK